MSLRRTFCGKVTTSGQTFNGAGQTPGDYQARNSGNAQVIEDKFFQ
jgi:hypothetical protein